MNRYLTEGKAAALLDVLQKSAYECRYEEDKHRLLVAGENGESLFQFRLPLLMAAPPALSASGTAKNNYVILLIQAGSCALGYFEKGQNLDHKVIRAYMVRKKQGKSQIKYLKTKGKSRAGSRVRLGEGVEFFENINERLQLYFREHDVQRVALSCSKTLLPFLFSSRVPTPFDKKDPRLLKIPKHVPTPIYEVLLDTNQYLLKGEIVFEASQQQLIAQLLGEVAADDHDAAVEPGPDFW